MLIVPSRSNYTCSSIANPLQKLALEAREQSTASLSLGLRVHAALGASQVRTVCVCVRETQLPGTSLYWVGCCRGHRPGGAEGADKQWLNLEFTSPMRL